MILNFRHVHVIIIISANCLATKHNNQCQQDTGASKYFCVRSFAACTVPSLLYEGGD